MTLAMRTGEEGLLSGPGSDGHLLRLGALSRQNLNNHLVKIGWMSARESSQGMIGQEFFDAAKGKDHGHLSLTQTPRTQNDLN
jgi:hypothetical protein